MSDSTRFCRGIVKCAPALRVIVELSSKLLGFLVSRDKLAPPANGSSHNVENRHAQGRLGLTAVALRAGAASLGLLCISGVSVAPAAAFPYSNYGSFWSFGIDSRAPNWHQSRRRHHTAKSAESVKPESPKQPSGPLMLAVSIANQRVTVYDNGTPIATSPISSGMAGHSTPMGVFSVIQKQRWHRSNLYSNAPMPYMQRITWSGVALHAGVLPGYPASHGCIRLPEGFAVRLWGMTKIGARVVITRNDAAPYEVNHPRLAGLVKAPEQAPEVGTLNAPKSAANIDKSEITDAVVVASTDAATDGAPAQEKLHDGAELPAFAAGASSPPQVAQAASVDGPAASPPAESSAPAPVSIPNAWPVGAAQRSGPISLFVSRKEGKLFVRRGFVPLFDVPITIAHREMPLGTHLFTASRPTDNSIGVRWLAVSIGYDRAVADPVPAKKHRARDTRDERPLPPTPEALRQAAVEALDRIELPQEALDRIAPLVTPGAHLLIADQGLGGETGRDTDFIVVTK